MTTLNPKQWAKLQAARRTMDRHCKGGFELDGDPEPIPSRAIIEKLAGIKRHNDHILRQDLDKMIANGKLRRKDT